MAKSADSTIGSKSNAASLQRGKACLRCRKRKMRCDGAKPACQQCTRAKKGDQCEYDDGKSKTRTQLLREQILRLEQRIRELEDPDYVSPAIVLHDPHGARHPSESESSSLASSTSPPVSNSHAPFSTPPTSHSPFTSQSPYLSGSPYTPVSDSAGPSSPRRLLCTLETSSSPGSFGSVSFPSGSDTYFEPQPSPEVGEMLLDIFVPHRHQCGLEIDLAPIRATLRHSHTSDLSASPRHAVLLNAIFLWACFVSRPGPLSTQENQYLARALAALPDAVACASGPSLCSHYDVARTGGSADALLDVLQASCLLATYFYATGRSAEASYHAGAAAALVAQHAIHADPAHWPGAAEAPIHHMQDQQPQQQRMMDMGSSWLQQGSPHSAGWVSEPQSATAWQTERSSTWTGDGRPSSWVEDRQMGDAGPGSPWTAERRASWAGEQGFDALSAHFRLENEHFGAAQPPASPFVAPASGSPEPAFTASPPQAFSVAVVESASPPPRQQQTSPAARLPTPVAERVLTGERILTFWQVYHIDRVWSALLNMRPVVPDDSDASSAINCPWPQGLAEYASGRAPCRAGFMTVRSMFDGDVTAGGLTIPASRAKAAAILSRAQQLTNAWDPMLKPTEAFQRDVAALEMTVQRFVAALIPVQRLGSALPEARQALVGTHTLANCALVLLYRRLAQGSALPPQSITLAHERMAYDKMVNAARACIAVLPHIAEQDYSFLDPAVGPCWALIADVLLQELDNLQALWPPIDLSASRNELELVLFAMTSMNTQFPILGSAIEKIQARVAAEGGVPMLPDAVMQ